MYLGEPTECSNVVIKRSGGAPAITLRESDSRSSKCEHHWPQGSRVRSEYGSRGGALSHGVLSLRALYSLELLCRARSVGGNYDLQSSSHGSVPQSSLLPKADDTIAGTTMIPRMFFKERSSSP